MFKSPRRGEANIARLQAVSNAGTASLFDGLQKREDRHALELKNVKDQAKLAASQHRAQLARAQAEVARVRKERDLARTDAARYYRERQLARAEVVELRWPVRQQWCSRRCAQNSRVPQSTSKPRARRTCRLARAAAARPVAQCDTPSHRGGLGGVRRYQGGRESPVPEVAVS